MLLSVSPPPMRPAPARPRPSRSPASRRTSLVRVSLQTGDGSGGLSSSVNSNPVLVAQSSPAPLNGRNLGLRRDPELGLYALLFPISLAFGSLVSLAIVSIPALLSFRKLAISADKLSKVVSEEVPGTLASLKLSGLEMNDLTSQLKNLRQRITGKQNGERIGANKPKSKEGRGITNIN